MAVNVSRSLNGSLTEGLTDGKVRKLSPDRENAESATEDSRSMLHREQYGERGFAYSFADQRPDAVEHFPVPPPSHR